MLRGGGRIDYRQGLNRVTAPGEALGGDIGFDSIFYRGKPVVADEKCTSGYVYFLNENYLEWYGLPSNKMGYKPINISAPSTVESPSYFDAPSTYGFFWTGFKQPTNQDAEIGQLILYGNLCNKSPRMHSVLQGVS